MVSGLEPDFAVISFNVFCTDFRGFWGIYTKRLVHVPSESGRVPILMATFRPRKKADGTISYTAQIRINRDKVTVYQ